MSKVPVSSNEKPVDYKNEFDRGTIPYDSGWRNYSFHKVTVSDGTVIQNCNFTQNEPKTKAISGKNLTFIDCNLSNNDLDNSWTLTRCNTAQVWFVEVDPDPLNPLDQTQKKPETLFVAKEPKDITGPVVKPVNQIKPKD